LEILALAIVPGQAVFFLFGCFLSLEFSDDQPLELEALKLQE
jgi:hypothetical protein